MREKFGRHSKKLDALLMEAVNLLAADMPLPAGISITHCRANGTITDGRRGTEALILSSYVGLLVILVPQAHQHPRHGATGR